MKIDFSLPVKNFADQISQNNNTAFIPKTYTEIRSFSNNRAAVRDLRNRWGFINESGYEVIPCQFEKVYDFDKLGNAVVVTFITGDYCYVIDINGKIIEARLISPSLQHQDLTNIDIYQFTRRDANFETTL